MSVNTSQNALASDINNIGHFVAGEAISSGDAVSLNYSDYKIYKASAAAFDHRLNFIGFAMAAAALNGAVSVNVLTVVNEKTGLTANTIYYLSNTQGAIGTAAGTFERIIGRSVSTTKLIRKRGFVSPVMSVSLDTGTVPCDGILHMNDGDTSIGSSTIDGVSVPVRHGFWAPIRMGKTFDRGNFSGSGNATRFVITDFGGFY